MKQKISDITHIITHSDPWWKVLLEIIFWSIITGLVIRVLLGMVIDEFELGVIHTIIIAAVFSTVFVVLGRITQNLMDRYFPFRHHYDLFCQIIFRTLYMITAFFIAVLITENALPYNVTILDWDTGTAWIILSVSLVAALIGNGFHQLYYFYDRMIKAERSAMNSQISALRAQINPHFLFNSLNSVASLIRVNPGKAERVTEDLAELFRYSLRSSNNEMVTLNDELYAVQTYFAIEKARFGDRVHLKSNVPEDFREITMPPFILQPLVENAIKHGAVNSTDDHTIEIVARTINKRCIEISVTDTGPGFDQPDKPQRYFNAGHGLGNVKERVEAAFHKSGSVDVMRNGVRIALPAKVKPGQSESQ